MQGQHVKCFEAVFDLARGGDELARLIRGERVYLRFVGSWSSYAGSVARDECVDHGVLEGLVKRHGSLFGAFRLPRAVCKIIDRLRYSSHESLFDGSEGKSACCRR